MMLGNDIQEFSDIGQGVIFEDLIASPPSRRLFKFSGVTDWSKEIRKWVPNELPLKALIDTSDRLGISTEVYTMLGYGAGEAVDNWLMRKGVSVVVYEYENIETLAYDLRFKRSMRTIYVPNQEYAKVIGIRATVVDTKRAWTI